MSNPEKVSSFADGARVVKGDRPCTILRALPNPSGRPENQWYDVRFDDYTMGRFAARELARLDSAETRPAA